MMIRIYERDAYVFEFEGTVTSVDDDWVSLNATAFYPGGGGQVSDRGTICGLDVTDVKAVDDVIMHCVPGHGMKVGDDVWCSVDWDKRYDLMMGHTAEHLLFGALKKEVPDIGIVKISISPENKYVIVDRDVGWAEIKRAQESVNRAINDNLCVVKSTMGRDDPDMDGIRARMERIDDDLVTVVEIGDADVAACSGIHVRETGEIGALIVDRKVSAGKDGYAIHFRIGIDAVSRSMDLANTCLQMIEIFGTKPEDAVKAAYNIKQDNDAKTVQLRCALSHAIDELVPEVVNGIDVYGSIFSINDRAVLTDAAERIKNSGSVAVLVSGTDVLSVIVSSGVREVDCSAVLKDAMTAAGGRGGGKKDFAQGGVPDASKADAVFNGIMSSVRASLKHQN
ncbi:MAG: alanyl-tRNA editing protein [Methanomassiliicoccaceae archaeon]|jgi:alanyl-tRNA synthetase|nr:alanyl-tRNA editing protein [Methanomassiliicoccaceae archaeon]